MGTPQCYNLNGFFGRVENNGRARSVTEKLQSEINRSFDNDRELQQRLRSINGMMRGTVRRSGQGGAWSYDWIPEDPQAKAAAERIIADCRAATCSRLDSAGRPPLHDVAAIDAEVRASLTELGGSGV